MFYGVALKPGQSTALTPQDGGEVLHLSQACMPQPKEGGKVYVQVTQEGKSYYICMLQKDHQESQQLDLFLSTRQGLSLKTEGAKNEVHLTGYFEPASEMIDSEEEESDEEQEEVAAEFLQADGAMKRHTPKKGGKVEDLDAAEEEDDDDEKSKLKALAEGMEDDDDEDEDEEEEEEEDDEDEDEDDELGTNGVAGASESDEEEDEEEEEEEEKQQPSSITEKKRKAQEAASGGGAAAAGAAKKKAKTGPQGGAPQQKQQQQKQQQQQQKGGNSGDAGSYKNALIDYLKKNGKTPLATLGQKVKKPAGVTEKMAQFLKSHASTFEVTNGVCALKG